MNQKHDSAYNRMRVIYYAEPLDEINNNKESNNNNNNKMQGTAKSIPDYESAGACWIDISELQKIKLRGKEPLQWFPYVASNQPIYPMSLMECWKRD